MKNKSRLLALALGLSLPWFGCNKAGKLNEHSVSKPAVGPVQFKLKWPQGERVEQEMNVTIKSKTDLPGQAAPMEQNVLLGQTFGLTVLRADPDGTHEIEMDFLTAHLNMKMGNQTLADYNSSKKAGDGKADPLGDAFGKIVGSKIRYFLDASNGVDHIEGIDDLIQRLSAGVPAQQAAPIKSTFTQQYFKQLMMANAILPTNAVQPGDTWPVHIESPQGMMGTMTLDFDFTFVGWELHGKRNCARLEFQGAIGREKSAESAAAPMSISIEDGTTSGVAWFDPELGIVIDSDSNQNMKLIIRMTQNAKNGPKTQTITNQMAEAVSIKLLSVK